MFFLSIPLLRDCSLRWDRWKRYMTPTLDAALLISSRAGADLGRTSDSRVWCFSWVRGGVISTTERLTRHTRQDLIHQVQRPFFYWMRKTDAFTLRATTAGWFGKLFCCNFKFFKAETENSHPSVIINEHSAISNPLGV